MGPDSTIPGDANTATDSEIGFHATNGEEDEAIIRAIKLNKFFGDKHVLKDIDFEVRKQEVVALIGPSGSGKSTLIRCLNAMEKLTSGEIYIHGKKLNPHLSVKHLSLIRGYFRLGEKSEQMVAALTPLIAALEASDSAGEKE
jgi:ABC-type cobalamin/Fe3+-siderophores transport system ATPase subunit